MTQLPLQTEETWVHISQDAAGCEAVSEQRIIWGWVLLLELRTSIKNLFLTVSDLFLQISHFLGTGMEELFFETIQHLLCLQHSP